jgi:3-hydroxybutyryl-CoA dehydrogenase
MPADESAATPVATLAVLGAGTMGQGIAQLAVTCAIEARLYDVAPPQLERAITAITRQLDKLVAKGKLTDEARQGALARLRKTSELADACRGVDAVIEAAPESMELKVELMQRVKQCAPEHALLGSNTSSLSLTELGRRIDSDARTVGLHFFNPPPVMPLLEVVRGLGTSEQTLQRAVALARQLGKEPIVVRDAPGFASSRLGVALGAEAMRMLETGVASAEDIDKAMELGYRHPMGPLKLTDLVGLDVRLAILEHLHRELGEQFRPPAILRQMVRAGRLGKKVGIGFYRWTDQGPVPDK